MVVSVVVMIRGYRNSYDQCQYRVLVVFRTAIALPLEAHTHRVAHKWIASIASR